MVELLDLLAVVEVRERLLGRGFDLPPYLRSFEDRLKLDPPEKTTAVIALPRRRMQDWTTLVAVARFRSPFSIIEELSELLAPTSLATGVVPTLMPLAERALQTMTWETPLVRHLQGNGLLLYRRGAER